MLALPIPEVRAKNGDACVWTSSKLLSFLRSVLPARIARRKSPWPNCFDCRWHGDKPPAIERATFGAPTSGQSAFPIQLPEYDPRIDRREQGKGSGSDHEIVRTVQSFSS